MKVSFIRILWVGLILSLILSYRGISIRMTNESNNKAVVPVVDYNDFLKASDKAEADIGEILEQFSKDGTKTVAVRETTLADLNYSGKAFVVQVSQYLAQLQGETGSEAYKLREMLTGKNLNPSRYLIITDNIKEAVHIEDRLRNRLENSKLQSFDFGNKIFYYIDYSLDKDLDFGIGFDDEVVRKLRESGFELVLRPRNSKEPSTAQIAEYEAQIAANNVKYIIFDGPEAAGYPLVLDSMWNIIKQYGIITGIIEAPSQVRFVEQKGLEEIISVTDYSINRTYITPRKDLEKLTGSDIYHRWIRCVVDRNIRFIYIQPLENPEFSSLENIRQIVKSAAELNGFLVSKGYSIDKPLVKLSSETPSVLHSAAVLTSVLFALLLYLIYLFGNKKRYIAACVMLAVLAGITAVTVLGFNMQQFIAAFAAIIYPSFASLLVLKYFKNHSDKPLLRQIPSAVAMLLGTSLLGAYTVVTTLSDIRYTMNTEVYKGVLISFSVPLMLFTINYFACFVQLEGLIGRIIGFLNKKVTYLAALAVFVGVFAIVLYLARSGNDSGIGASALELKIRNALEEAMAARPRFKEFIVGYPALLSAAYLFKKFKKDMILLPLGIAFTIGSVSIVNSFCHVFTAVEVAALRAVNGLVLGIFAGLAAIAALRLGIYVYQKKIFR